jgi:hypothetical protein
MTMKKLSSVITGQQSGLSSPTGNPNTEAGALTLSTSEKSAALTTLRSADPRETDKALLSLLKQLGIWLQPNIDNLYEVTSYNVHIRKDAHKAGYCWDTLPTVQKAFVPLPPDQMEKALLTSMMLMVKPSGESPEDAAMRVQLYAHQMQDWPADIFNRVLKLVIQRNTFWPAFADFHKEYEWLARNRLKIREALHLCMK